jgi:hypothetical protein
MKKLGSDPHCQCAAIQSVVAMWLALLNGRPRANNAQRVPSSAEFLHGEEMMPQNLGAGMVNLDH